MTKVRREAWDNLEAWDLKEAEVSKVGDTITQNFLHLFIICPVGIHFLV